jgi:glycosyltransferase involved in cell wall biosynthesis
MRVLQVTAIPITAVRFVEPLMQSLRRSGYEVELACGPGRGLQAVEAEDFPVHVVPISRNVLNWRNLHAVGAIRALLRSGSFDFLHVHTPGVRVFYTMHGSLWGSNASARSRAMFTLIERRHGRRTDRVFTVNPEDAEDCVRRARIPQERVQVLPAGGAGVAPEFYLTEDEGKRLGIAARAKLGIGADAPVIAYVGRTAEAKGIGVLARAFSQIAGRDQSARLLIVGGPLEGERGAYDRERFLTELGQPGASRVSWIGFSDHVASYIAAADVVVLLSSREGFGMSLAEAAAMGRPVVATETRGANTVVTRDVTGFLVPQNDPKAVSNNVLRLLHDSDLAAKMGSSARERAKRFTREAVVHAYVNAYEAARSEESALA